MFKSPKFALTRSFFGKVSTGRRNGHAMLEQKKLGVERLEKRQLLAAYINEIHYNPLFGDNGEDQYIELRGEPGATLDPGTLFLGIESADGVNELGDVHTIIDLSNQSFGQNGILVLLQSGGGYEVAPEANVIRGSNGFQGMPDGIFRSDNESPSLHGGSSTYLLIQTDTPLAIDLDTDIDGNDDGFVDGLFSPGTVLDGVSVLPWVESVWTQRAYAPIVFSEDGVGSALPGATFIQTDQLAYVGRVGASTGFSPDDWMSGNTVEVSGSGSGQWQFQLQHGVFGTPRPYAFGGRILEHVGAPNWYGSVAGQVIQDLNQDGTKQADEIFLPGVDVGIDFGVAESDQYATMTIDPDDYAVGSEITNISPFVTMVSAGSDNVHQGFKNEVVPRYNPPTSDNVFSHAGVGFFNENRRLRMDFYQPVHSVSIDVIGSSNLTETYGRLEIFDRDDNSLGFVRSAALGGDEVERLSISSGGSSIAWALAYSEDSYLNSSPFGKLDHLTFEMDRSLFEARTNESGNYQLNRIPKGDYSIGVKLPENYEQVFPTNGQDYAVSITNEYESLQAVTFGLIGTVPPSLSDLQLSFSELSKPGALVELPITLGYATQQLDVSITSGNPTGLFGVDMTDGSLVLNRDELDFESVLSYTLELLLVDQGDSNLIDTATLEITILDGNEPPSVSAQETELQEHSENDTFVATMQATDEDAGLAGEFVWSISGGNEDGAFKIDPNSGAVTVADSAAVNFESLATRQLVIRATDRGNPTEIGEATLTVNLQDINEPPVIPPQDFSVDENSSVGTAVGRIARSDPDAGQTLSWSVVGGSGSELFRLDSLGNILVTQDALDFETNSLWTLVVRATDSGEPPLVGTQTISIRVNDANDAPTIDNDQLTAPEDATGSIGMIEASDQDVGQTLTYAITGGADAGRFEIVEGTGEVLVADGATFDFETSPMLEVEVTVTDSHAPPRSTTRFVTVTLSDVNEAPDVSGDTFAVPENSSGGTVIGTVSASDPDANDTLTFELVSQAEQWVRVDATTGEIVVLNNANIDFEAQPNNSLVVRATDLAGASAQATILLRATDQNDAPEVAIPIADVSVEEGDELQFEIPEATFTDQDAGDSLTFRVTDGDGFSIPSWLTFDPATRILSGSPTSANVGVIELVVTAVDSGRKSVTDRFRLEVKERPFPWHNAQLPEDATGDGNVTPVDALTVINYLNSGASSEVPSGSQPDNGLIDTNGDNSVTPVDALIIINFLNARGAGEGEGEPNNGSKSLASSADFFSDLELKKKESEAAVDRILQDLALVDFH